MFKNERLTEIVNILKSSDGFVSVRELCKKLYASESSIRRDLGALEEKGIVERSYGGASLITNRSDVIPYSKRAYHDIESKKIIAKKAIKLIPDKGVIFLDQSSTAFYLACEIPPRSNITVVTNNTAILNIMANTSVHTISSGGSLSGRNRVCLLGNEACRTFESINADFSFFSVKSLSENGILSDCDREEVAVRSSMISNSAVKVFLCGSEKLGSVSPYKQLTLAETSYLVCENNDALRFRRISSTLNIM